MTIDTNTVPRRGRPRLCPVPSTGSGQAPPRNNKAEYARRKALAKARGEITTVTNYHSVESMQPANRRYTLAYTSWLAWASQRPQACVVGSYVLWVPVPPRMPRLPADI